MCIGDGDRACLLLHGRALEVCIVVEPSEASRESQYLEGQLENDATDFKCSS